MYHKVCTLPCKSLLTLCVLVLSTQKKINEIRIIFSKLHTNFPNVFLSIKGLVKAYRYDFNAGYKTSIHFESSQYILDVEYCMLKLQRVAR